MTIQQTATGPNTEPVQLKRRIKHSQTSSVGFIPVGILGLGMGAFSAAYGLGLMSGNPGTPHPLMSWFPMTFLFGMSGVFLILAGLHRGRRKAHRAAAGADVQHRPWLYDRKWNAQGTEDDTDTHMGAAVGGLVVMGLALVAILGQGQLFPLSSLSAQTLLVLGLMGFACLVLLGWLLRSVLQRRRFGVAKLHFERFPYFMGEMLEARFEPGWGDRPIDMLRIILRCVQEGPDSEKAVVSSNGQTACWQIYADAVTYYNVGAWTPGRGVPVTFPLPDRPDRANDLLSPYVRYWEVEVEATSGGRSYQGRFLVPVYARAVDGGQ